MKCSDIQSELAGYLSGEIDSGLSALIREHLDNCPACASEMRQLSHTVSRLKTLASPQIPAGMESNIRLQLTRLTNAAPTAKRTGFTLPRIAAAALALAAAVGACITLWKSPTSPISTPKAGRQVVKTPHQSNKPAVADPKPHPPVIQPKTPGEPTHIAQRPKRPITPGTKPPKSSHTQEILVPCVVLSSMSIIDAQDESGRPCQATSIRIDGEEVISERIATPAIPDTPPAGPGMQAITRPPLEPSIPQSASSDPKPTSGAKRTNSKEVTRDA